MAETAKNFHVQRSIALKQYNMSLRDLYRLLEQLGANLIKDIQSELDKAIIEAYNFNDEKDILSQLLTLNQKIAAREARKENVQPPGLPDFIKNKETYITDECVKFEWE
ncbi:MAG: hypothetical protein ABIW38_05915 [Ferruginibacter sp.]